MSGMPPRPRPKPIGALRPVNPASSSEIPSFVATSTKRPVANPMKGWSGRTRVQKRTACSASSSVSGGGTHTESIPKYS